MDLLARVRRTIERHGLAEHATRVIVALSGGPDSVALAYLLHELDAAGELDFAGLAHFNHQLRASASRDEAVCREVAAALGRPILIDRGDVAAFARRERRSLEDAARRLRYEFLARARSSLTADAVALGHSRDDQAETFLLRLLRGAGPRGLGSMHPRRGVFIRPLLDCRRDELRAYLEDRDVRYAVDETNDDVRIPRNRVRAELVPLLVRRFNPAVVDALADAADIAREDWRWLQQEAEALAERISQHDGDIWRIDADGLNRAPVAVARALLYQTMMAAARGATVPFRHVAAALDASRGHGSPLDAPGHRVEREGRFLVLTSKPPRAKGRWGGGSRAGSANFFRYPLSIPGEVALPQAGCVISAQRMADREVPADIPGERSTMAAIRMDRVRGALAVRNRRPGDRFRPLGLDGRKKLQDYFVDEKVARRRRDEVPLVVDESDRILWVAGYGIDQEFKATDAAQGVVVLRVRQL